MTCANVHRVVATAVAIAVVFSAGTVAAGEPSEDDELVEVSEGQLDLNEQGVAAIAEGDYERAIRLFEASLDLGKLNVTYANLARAYQRDGQCEKAEEYFDEALQAPRADEPTPEQIKAAIERYRAELEETCPGYLDVTCEPEELALFIDAEGPMHCQVEEPRELVPGTYALVGEYEEFETETTVDIEAMETMRVRLALTDEELEKLEDDELEEVAADDVVEMPTPDHGDVDNGELADVADSEEAGANTTMAWLMLTGSAVALAGGVALDTIPEQASNGEINAINFVPVGLYGASITMGWMGVRAAW